MGKMIPNKPPGQMGGLGSRLAQQLDGLHEAVNGGPRFKCESVREETRHLTHSLSSARHISKAGTDNTLAVPCAPCVPPRTGNEPHSTTGHYQINANLGAREGTE